MGNVSQAFKDTIKAYLDKRASEDELFAKTYAKKEKNLDQCCNYIIQEVQKLKVCGLSDDEVFSLAVHYYDEDNLGEIKESRCQVVVNHTVELTEEEKQQAKARAIADYEARVRAELESESKKNSTPAPESSKKPKAKSSVSKNEPKVQALSLFDLIEESDEAEN